MPDQPGVDRAEGQFAGLRAPTRVGHMVEQPAQLGSGKIRIEPQAGAFGEQRFVLHQLRAHRCGAPVVPHDGRMHRFARRAVP